MKREHQEPSTTVGVGCQPPSNTTASRMAKRKLEEDSQDAGVDELLAALGYKVRSSDMADVAQKLEQLDMAMGADDGGHDDAVVSHLADDTVHYNPSDLSAWLENMLSEINAPPLPVPPPTTNSSADPRKKMRTSSSSSSLQPPIPMVAAVDPQETGVRLVHTLMACAEAVEQANYAAADSLLKQIPFLAASQAGAMRKVAGYFADALGRRIYRRSDSGRLDPTFSDVLQMHFYESCPYLKFAHFTANQAILDAFSGYRKVHVIDFGMKQEGTLQWPALMQALALRPGGPPSFRLTGVGSDALQRAGWKLARLADAIHLGFEYRGLVVGSLADLEPRLLGLGEGEDEAVAVNSVFELHRLLAESDAAVDKVLDAVRAIKPKIFTVVEQEANHNAGRFSERFNEALHYYSTMFDSLEGGRRRQQQEEEVELEQDQMMTEMYLGREICNVVACEGEERTERHETAARWKGRLVRAGFEPVCLGSNAFKQASMLLALFAGSDGYGVEEEEGCLTLGWHARPLIVTSAWRPAGR